MSEPHPDFLLPSFKLSGMTVALLHCGKGEMRWLLYSLILIGGFSATAKPLYAFLRN